MEPKRYTHIMRLFLSHKTFQQHDAEQIIVEGSDYETLYAQAIAQIPEGRIAASVRVEK